MSPWCAYLAAPDLRDELEAELHQALAQRTEATEFAWHGDLCLVQSPLPSPPLELAWAAETFESVEIVSITSIGDAARQLRDRQGHWVHLSIGSHRRGELIAEKLPRFRPRRLRFGEVPPAAPLGHFGLLAPDRLLILPRGRTGMARGVYLFDEDHEGPPSRAYLKLWELFTRLGVRPAPGQTCLDLGACPGGWTWVLLQLGAQVVAVDKAPLDEALLGNPRLLTLGQSAFAPLPEGLGEPDWVFSDVICYPERLLRLVQEWLARPAPPSVVATIKFQGEVEPSVLRTFAAIPGARLLHLSRNKHELTFVRLADEPSTPRRARVAADRSCSDHAQSSSSPGPSGPRDGGPSAPG